MDIFEYLPQLIVAYDGSDEFANLIHVKKADKDNDYYCPCCGGIVKPRALDSNKEQSHYYHKTGKCTKESQLHFFCKNWLFETGSKFYIDNTLYEVDSIEIEKTWNTPFGDYKPDVTVHTTDGKTIYFEMFFTNRKTGDDYFCKWTVLENDVVEVNIKEYMFKTDTTTIPSFTYLYHNDVCYSKPYVKRDLYANTIARIKHELTRQKVLNYKARIEQLDWFWQEIRNNTRESILEIVSQMEYEDMVSCYEIIKRKQCVSYLKDDVLNIINQKVVSDVRESLDLPHDENVYFDLKHIKGRTYEAGIRLNLKTEHIIHDKLYSYWEYTKIKIPKIVFSKNIFTTNALNIVQDKVEFLKELFCYVVEYKNKLLKYEKALTDFENSKYKIRVRNQLHTVLIKTDDNSVKTVLDKCYIDNFDIDNLNRALDEKLKEIEIDNFLELIFSSTEYGLFLQKSKEGKISNITIDIHKLYSGELQIEMNIGRRRVYKEILKIDFNEFIEKLNNCISIIDGFENTYQTIIELVDTINNCKNKFWKSEFDFDNNGYPKIKIDQKYYKNKYGITWEKVYLYDFVSLSKENIISFLENGMKQVLKNMEQYGCRVMEVCS